MTLKEKIRERAAPMERYYKEMFEETNLFQKQVLLYAEQQDTLNAKLNGLYENMEILYHKKEIAKLDLGQHLTRLDKIHAFKMKSEPLQILLIGHSKPLINEIFDYQDTFIKELTKLASGLSTEEEAENIFAGLDKDMKKLTSNLDTIKQRLTNCQNVYNEMKALYESNVN